MEQLKLMRGIDYVVDGDGLGKDIVNYIEKNKPASNSYDITTKDLEIILQDKIESVLKDNNLLNRSWWDVFDENDHKCRNLFVTLCSLSSFLDIINFYDELSTKVNNYIVDELTPIESRELC